MTSIKVLKHSDSGKSCFCKVSKKVGPFTSEVGIGYLYLEEGNELPEVGSVFPYPGEVDFTPLVDNVTGEIRTTKDGVTQLQRIVLK